MHPNPPDAPQRGKSGERRPHGLPLVARLLAFGLALLLPAVLVSGVLLWKFAASERAKVEAEVQEAARYRAEALDHKLETYHLALRMLSQLAQLRSGDLSAFHAEAIELGRLENFAVVLSNMTGQPLLDTRVALGASLPPTPEVFAATARHALDRETPTVSDLLVNPTTRSAEFAILLPVRLADAEAGLLGLVLPAEAALQVLRRQELPGGWTSSYVDNAGRIAARSARDEEFVGTLATEDLRRNATGEAGTWLGTTATGQPVRAAYSRSQLSGWRAAVGVPVTVVRAPLHRSLWILSAFGAAALITSALLAWWTGRSVAGPIRQLADAAHRLGRGETPATQPTRIREVDRVGEAIEVAAQGLRDRAQERDRADEALREETRSLETLNHMGALLAAELDLDRLLQAVTDAATELSGAQFGAFFYNAPDPQGGHYTLYTLSGAPREAFSRFPLPRATALFGPTFRGEGVVRIADVMQDPRFGRNAPFRGMPEGHLPVRSYLAAPVISRTGDVIGGLFFGHAEPGVFTERAERLVTGIAAQAAVAADNARLFQEAARAREALEQRVAERTHELEEANTRLREEVSAREAAQARLAQAQKMEALGQLAGGIAHDFNNVLQAVAGALRLIADRAEDAGRVRQLAGMASEAAERGASVTRRLLTFARQSDLRVEPVDAGALLADLGEVLAHMLGAGIEVRVEAASPLPPVFADRGQLETVLVNLATNARDAMLGGGRLTLSVASEAVSDPLTHPTGLGAGTYLRVSVTDTGVGMNAATLARAAEPFFTTKPLGKGTGLGLAMAKGFAEQSGGGLAIRSEPNIGTTVTLWLPSARAGKLPQPGIARNKAASTVTPAAAACPVERQRVLLVDDEPLVRRTLAAELSARGWTVAEAEGPAGALMRLETAEPFDLLVTDFAMPGMDGLALVREVRRRRPELPVLLLTGYVEDGTLPALREAEAGGPFALLRKPVSADELADCVGGLMGVERASIGRR